MSFVKTKLLIFCLRKKIYLDKLRNPNVYLKILNFIQTYSKYLDHLIYQYKRTLCAGRVPYPLHKI